MYKRSKEQAMQARSPAGSCDPGENAAMTFQIAEKTLMVCLKSKNKPWYEVFAFGQERYFDRGTTIPGKLGRGFPFTL